MNNIQMNLLLNLPSNNNSGMLLQSIANHCKVTTPFAQRELRYLKEQQLVEQTCLDTFWKRTISGDQLLEQELNKSYM